MLWTETYLPVLQYPQHRLGTHEDQLELPLEYLLLYTLILLVLAHICSFHTPIPILLHLMYNLETNYNLSWVAHNHRTWYCTWSCINEFRLPRQLTKLDFEVHRTHVAGMHSKEIYHCPLEETRRHLSLLQKPPLLPFGRLLSDRNPCSGWHSGRSF